MTPRIQRFHPRLAALALLPALAACGTAGPSGPTPAADAGAAAATITAADIGSKIDILAADSMAGRDTPSPGLETAARYIADRLRAAGLEPLGEDGGYIDRYEYRVATLDPTRTRLGVAGETSGLAYGEDYFMVLGSAPVEAHAYYVGVAGEAGPPPAEARGKVLVYRHPGAEVDQEWQTRLGATLPAAAAAGAAGVLFIQAPDFDATQMPPLAAATAEQQAPFAIAGVTDEAGRVLLSRMGEDLDALEAAGAPAPLGTSPLVMEGARLQQNETPPNVVGILRGSDPELAETFVVVTAHFDHLGTARPDETGDSVYNGADDNASGTAAALEVAEALGTLDQAPARSVIVLLVSGEEDGLLGSTAWVDHPPVDIGSVVANINMDMVGRNAADTVIGIGQEYSTLGGVLDTIIAARPDLGLNVILDPVPEERYFFRSDQLPFIQRGIPAVFFTGHDHEDYHRRSDESHMIDDDKAARVARLAFYLAHAIATDPVAPEWTPEGEAEVQEILREGM